MYEICNEFEFVQHLTYELPYIHELKLTVAQKRQKNLNFILCYHREVIKITLFAYFNQMIQFSSIFNQWSSIESVHSINLKLQF